jgi:hypothetical protein
MNELPNGHGNRAAWVRLVIQIVMMIIVGCSLWFGLVARVANQERMATEDRAMLMRMDEQGTNASKWGIREEMSSIKNLTGRLEKLEDNTRKLDVMDEKISRIEGDVKELKARHP